jgi:hypothetical protein
LTTAFSAAAQERHAGADAVLDTARIEQLIGAKGVLDATEGVFKVMMPRTDLRISVAGVRVTPPKGLTSWAAFKGIGGHDMVMGDLVLTEDQVNPVMDVALDSGLEVTALHNHFFRDSPYSLCPGRPSSRSPQNVNFHPRRHLPRPIDLVRSPLEVAVSGFVDVHELLRIPIDDREP